MATTHRSELVERLEVALTDEVYDGAFGPLNEAQLSAHVRRLAETAAEVVDSAAAALRADGHPLGQNEESHSRSGEPQTRSAYTDEQQHNAQHPDGCADDHPHDVHPNVITVDVAHLTTLAPRAADVYESGEDRNV
ncbi:MAG: hypothetical protein AAGC61_01920 [Microbacterium sp.]